MPQMDFAMFFPQVFWLILMVSIFFLYIFRDYFSAILLILKIKSTKIYFCIKKFNFLYFMNFMKIICTIRSLWIEFINNLNYNNFLRNKDLNFLKFFYFFFNFQIQEFLLNNNSLLKIPSIFFKNFLKANSSF